MQSLPKVQRQTLVESIAQELIRYIAANELKGGDPLPSERELMEEAGVSRLPLREALCMLKGLGIIEAQHGRGMFVRHLDVSAVFGMLSPLLRTQAHIDIEDIIQVRLHLESSIAELAAAQRDEENLAVLSEALVGMEAHLGDAAGFIRHDMTFHQELARSTGNPIFHVFIMSITDLLAEIQFSYPDKRVEREKSLAFHQRTFDAVNAGDGAAARVAMQEHILNIRERICRNSTSS